MITVAIICGGLGTRVESYTQGLPKSLVPIHGRSFIDYQLELLAESGVERVVLCVGYGGKIISDYVGDGRQWGLRVLYSWDETKNLGTGGALRDALPLLGPEFLVLYGDVYIRLDYVPMLNAFRQIGALAMVAMCRGDGLREQNNIARTGGYTVRYDKRHHEVGMMYLDAGVSAYRASVFENVAPEGPLDLGDVMHELSINRNLWGYQTYHKPHEVGSLEGIREFEERVERGNLLR